ncbi:MAG: MATE family efflux transporter [Lachnospiraceae bacterium]|nr:MATE family efflux transporter [Lachnospiraceae bacterium]
MTREEALAYKLNIRECIIGERDFYSRVFMIVVPMVIQNTLSNVVGLLDNVMVGRLGTLPMSAVAIVNQLMFVFYLCIFGALSGAGIFSTQYFGKGDLEGVRHTIRFKLIVAGLICTGALLVFLTLGPQLIGSYIAADTAAADRATTMELARTYLAIMLVGLFPFGLTQVYAGAMRESGQTTLPMIASITAMIVNFIFNALLIFGLLGFPRLGVAGAAIATVLSRFVETGIVMIKGHRDQAKYGFFTGLYKNFRIPKDMIWPILSKSAPLFANEFLWSMGQASLMQAYSVRGIEVIAALNIANTISQIFNEIFFSIGVSSGIITGQELGANRLVSARRSAWRIACLSVATTFVMGTLLFIAAPFVPNIYNTEPEIRQLASEMIRIIAITTPFMSVANVSYFILRSGGKTLITFLFDSCFMWVICMPLAYVLTRYTDMDIRGIFLIICMTDAIKTVLGLILIKRGSWVKNIVAD